MTAKKKQRKPAVKRVPDPVEPDPVDDEAVEQVVARSAVTGRFVSFWYAVTHPRTTVRERRR